MVIGWIAGIGFLAESYGRVLVSPFSGVTFLLWLVALLAVVFVVMCLADLVLIILFPPEVERVYANDTYTTLRLDD